MEGHSARLFSDNLTSTITGITVLVAADSESMAGDGAHTGGLAAGRRGPGRVTYETATH